MLWVVRAGQKSKFITSIIENSEIYLPWEGYSFPLNTGKTADEYRKIVMKEKGTENRTSVSNWSGQINSFVNEIKIGDYVLIPMFKSREYVLATVSGEYTFNNRNENGLYHSRKISIIATKIPADIFTQPIRYSLGAFRTIFKVKQERDVLKSIDLWRKK
ncbi:restriction endonuclease [Mediterraneibacter glycyrrhizinilyticus]|uniref:restriction endonuclease n=1 Tax=Mediterraneibacter glycyrrhizinilyticus TaxID=342942 RepID=UPI0025A4A3F8|nr:hypothetical protein [Mediterraneibacter glycyrrhizinilyticus]MDM8125709.1 hypothetical protein [Mediterraneibacter glycyrrhizinilyticus]